jgi:hypothetical protein
MHRIRNTFMLLAAVAVLPPCLEGQQVIKASATVLPSVQWIESQDMSFGQLNPTGAPTDRVVDLLSLTVDAINGNAGRLDYRLNRSGQFTFAMPTSLASTTSGSTLAVGSWECGLMIGTSPVSVTDPGNTAGLTGHDTSAGCTTGLPVDVSAANGARLVRVYIGGSILASAFQAAPAETFEGDITVTFIVP